MKDSSGNATRSRESNVNGNALAIAGDGTAALRAEPRDGRTGVQIKVSDKHTFEGIMSSAVRGCGLEATKNAAAAQIDGCIRHGIAGTVLHCARNSSLPEEADFADHDLAGRRQNP